MEFISDLISEILTHCTIKDILNMNKVCSKLHYIIISDSFWNLMCHGHNATSSITWRQFIYQCNKLPNITWTQYGEWSHAPPVLVFYGSKMCTYTKKLLQMQDQIISVIKQIYPYTRFITLLSDDFSGNINMENIPPKFSFFLRRWFPMIILIPGHIWNAFLTHFNGIQILNAYIDNNEICHDRRPQYDFTNIVHYGEWFENALNMSSFQNFQ